MTLEEIKEIGEKVVKALNASSDFTNAEVLEDSIVPGEPIPIAFTDGTEDLVVSLDVL